MNKTPIDYTEGDAQLIQFVRAKGKRAIRVLPNGKIVRDSNGKPTMVREKGDPRGILVAGMINGQPRLGWSFTNTGKDKFDKTIGLQIATNRMRNTRPRNPFVSQIPHDVARDLKMFIPRVEKYFGVPVGIQ